MLPESTSVRSSFFDDDDMNLRFEFVRPDKLHLKYLSSPAILKDSLALVSTTPNSFEKATFALHGRILAFYENNGTRGPQLVLDLAHSRLQLPGTSPEEQGNSFAVTRNGNTFRFYHPDKRVIENWMTALKSACVLLNFHDEYKALKMIGKGSFAKVYLVESKVSKKNFAVKAFTKEGVIISNKANAKPAMLNEIDIMRVLDHENVIKLHEVYETEKSIYLVLELIQGKSLQELLKKQSFKEENNEIRIINTCRSILDALAYLASKGVMHRDLKPDNILLDKGEKVKIVDFGLATFIDVPEYIFKKCGTPGYISPEVFKYDVKNPATFYDDHCDVFSIGCILYFMFFGVAFFEGTNASEILKANRKFTADHDVIGRVKNELKDPNSKISKDGLTLLLQLLEFDQKKRPSATQALSHPFFTPVPTGMQKVGFSEAYGHNEIIKNGYYSPLIVSPVKRSASRSPDKHGSSPLKDRFHEKDSLYLDVGKTEINGRIDTINNGSMGNSILFASRASEINSAASSNSNSPYKKGYGDSWRLEKRNSGAGTGPGNLDFSKQMMYRTGYKGGEEEEYKGDDSPILKLERLQNEKRHKTAIEANGTLYGAKLRGVSQSPEKEAPSADYAPFHLKVEHIPQVAPQNQSNPTKAPHSGRRFQPFSQKNT